MRARVLVPVVGAVQAVPLSATCIAPAEEVPRLFVVTVLIGVELALTHL